MSTLIALLDASAEGGGAAVANVAQRFSLLAREHVSSSGPAIAVMSADDVGHLGPTRAHGSMS